MNQLIPHTYEMLFEAASRYSDIHKPDVRQILTSLGFNSLSLSAISPIFYVVDYSSGKYLYIDPRTRQVLGYDAETLMKEGPSFYLSKWHPNDQIVFNKKVFPEAMQFLKNQKPYEYPNFSFTLNYRFKTLHGSYINMLQRSIYYFSGRDGTPIAAVGFGLDITHFKDDSSIVHIIEKVNQSFYSTSKSPIIKSIYYPDSIGILSSREMELCTLMLEGFTSKEIAKRLSISIHTVNNHRKNMLQKTKTKNASELLNYIQKIKGYNKI